MSRETIESLGLPAEMLQKIRDACSDEIYRLAGIEDRSKRVALLGEKIVKWLERPYKKRRYHLTFQIKRRKRHALSSVVINENGSVTLHSRCSTGSNTVSVSDALFLIVGGKIAMNGRTVNGRYFYGVPAQWCAHCWHPN